MEKTKDTFYFPHDFGARNDPKLLSLMVSHGVAGIGIFWCIIEQLYEQGGTLPLSSCKSIAFALHVDSKTIEDVIRNHELFQNDGELFWSESVLERIEKRKSIAKQRKRAAVKRWESKNKKVADANAMQMHSKCNANAMQNDAKERKGKERKDIYIVSKDTPVSDAQKKDEKEKKDDQKKNETLKKDSKQQKNDVQKIDYGKVMDLYHKTCPSFPKLLKLSDSRKQKIKIRLQEMRFDFELLEKIFKTMESSDFLRGDNTNNWQASFDWVFENSKNWLKIVEGNYDNKKSLKNVNDLWN